MIREIFHITCDRCNKALKESSSIYGTELEAYKAAKKKGWFFQWVLGKGEYHYCPACTKEMFPDNPPERFTR